MNKVFLLVIIIFSSCYFNKSISKVARKEGLSVKEVAEIDLLGGRLEIKDRSPGRNSVYLLYRGDSLLYLSGEKQIPNGDYIYRIHRWHDSLYMLTRKGQFRYFNEDTILFHSDHIVSNRCVYGRDPNGKPEIVQAFFTSYHLTPDSIIKFSKYSMKPFISIHQYGADQKVTEQFISDHAEQTKLPRGEMGSFMKDLLR